MVFEWIKKIIGEQDSEPQEQTITKKSDGKKVNCEKIIIKKTKAKKIVDKNFKSEIKQENFNQEFVRELEINPKDKPKEKNAEKPKEEAKNKSWLSRLSDGLGKSSSKITEGITGVFTKRKLDNSALQDLEDILIMSDMGVEIAKKFTKNIAESRFDKEVSDDEIKVVLSNEIEQVLTPVCKPINSSTHNPQIILVVGVNGSGKTTTIGKLAKQYVDSGKKVVLGAGDTFRAAAIEQLAILAERTGAEIVKKEVGADVGALAYEAVEKGISLGADVIILDSAGRLYNKEHLMEELKKMRRVIGKLVPDAPHDVLLVLDGTVGQNAIEQVKRFKECVDVTGLIMTKLDGSAKGGVLVNIAHTYGLPIHAIGVGEAAEDLNSFEAKDFANSLMGLDRK